MLWFGFELVVVEIDGFCVVLMRVEEGEETEKSEIIEREGWNRGDGCC